MKKTFDCLKMKDELQRAHRAKVAGMTAEEERQYIQNLLATSDSPVAQWWRERNEAKSSGTSVGPRNT